jgi:hypothetical protein
MIFTLEKNERLIITRVDADAPIVSLSGSFITLWKILNEQPYKTPHSSPVNLAPLLMEFLKFLEQYELIPNRLSLAAAATILSDIVIDFDGEFKIDEVPVVKEVFASLAVPEDPYTFITIDESGYADVK